MIHNYLLLSVVLFCIGIVGVIARRNVFTVFMSIELMLNAANLAFVAFSRFHESMDGHVLALHGHGCCRRRSSYGPCGSHTAAQAQGQAGYQHLQSAEGVIPWNTVYLPESYPTAAAARRPGHRPAARLHLQRGAKLPELLYGILACFGPLLTFVLCRLRVFVDLKGLTCLRRAVSRHRKGLHLVQRR
jgi:hypothetical protein